MKTITKTKAIIRSIFFIPIFFGFFSATAQYGCAESYIFADYQGNTVLFPANTIKAAGIGDVNIICKTENGVEKIRSFNFDSSGRISLQKVFYEGVNNAVNMYNYNAKGQLASKRMNYPGVFNAEGNSLDMPQEDYTYSENGYKVKTRDHSNQIIPDDESTFQSVKFDHLGRKTEWHYQSNSPGVNGNVRSESLVTTTYNDSLLTGERRYYADGELTMIYKLTLDKKFNVAGIKSYDATGKKLQHSTQYKYNNQNKLIYYKLSGPNAFICEGENDKSLQIEYSYNALGLPSQIKVNLENREFVFTCNYNQNSNSVTK